MSFISAGLIASASLLVLLCSLFSYEGRRGARYFPRMRTFLDRAVAVLEQGFTSVTYLFGREFIRQISHYAFHSFLKIVLKLTARLERRVRSIMRVNKTLARNVERESMYRSKLEEIALHKAEHALSDDEKRAHRERALSGM